MLKPFFMTVDDDPSVLRAVERDLRNKYDTNAAISAINDVRLHHYLMKPWDPPETKLYPVLDDLLADWLAEYSPPVIVFPDGSCEDCPDSEALASKLELHTKADTQAYDLVIGGANSAGQAAMSKYLIDQIEATPNIELRPHSEVVAVEGTEQLESITFRNRPMNSEETVAAQLLFIFTGARPCTEWLRGTLCLDEHGFVRTGPSLSKNGQLPQRWPLPRDPMLLETSIPGVFAAGDTRNGSVVVQFVHHSLSGH